MTRERLVPVEGVFDGVVSGKDNIFGRKPFDLERKFLKPLSGAPDDFVYACSREVHAIRAMIAEDAEAQEVINEEREISLMMDGGKKDKRGRKIHQ